MNIFTLNKCKSFVIKILYYFNLNKKSDYITTPNYNTSNYNTTGYNTLNYNSNDCIKWRYKECSI